MRQSFSTFCTVLLAGCLGCTATDPKRDLRQTHVEEFAIPTNDKKFTDPPTYAEQKRKIGEPTNTKVAAPQMPGGGGPGGSGGPRGGGGTGVPGGTGN